jgi:hypothetical protein
MKPGSRAPEPVPDTFHLPWPLIDQRDIVAKIRATVHAGMVPLDAPDKVWAGYGSRRGMCDAFDLHVANTEIEYELDLPTTPTATMLRFHKACLALWHEERAGRMPPPA